MKKTLALAISASLLLTLGACKKDEYAATDASTDTSSTVIATGSEVPGVGAPGDVNPITAQTWVDDVTIGNEVGADGMMVTGRTGDDFAPGQPVYIAMNVKDAPANSAVKIVWYGPNETKITEESKTVTAGQQYLSFAAMDTKAWAKGDYRAEIWVADEKVNTQQFNITDASKAGDPAKASS